MLLLNYGFPYTKTLPAELNVHISLPPGDAPRRPPTLVRTLFGFEIVLVRTCVSSGHPFAPEAVTRAHRETQRRPKALQSLALGVCGRPPIREPGNIERTPLFTMF